MNINRKGFTLVELLAVIVVLSLVLVISGYGIVNAYKNSKDKIVMLNEAGIKEAARIYSTEAESREWRELDGDDNEYFCTTIQRLKNAGLLKKEATSEKFSSAQLIGVQRDKITYTVNKVMILSEEENDAVYDLCKRDIKFFSLHYDPTGGNNAPRDDEGETGLPLSVSRQEPTKTGYYFSFWYDDLGSTYHAGDSFIGTEEKQYTLYANWHPNTYKIKLNPNGGNGSVIQMTCEYDSDCRLLDNSFTRSGYVFAGWSETASGDVKYTNEELVRNLTSTNGDTINLYANWQSVEYYVWYDGNGNTGENYTSRIGSYASGSRVNGSVFESARVWKYGEYQKLIANQFVKEGYTFTGWTHNTYTTISDQQNVRNLRLTPGTVVLVANWVGNNYSVKFDANGGSGRINTKSCYYDSSCVLPSSGFTREGYALVGWSKTPTGGIDYNLGANAGNMTSTKDATINLYAVWKKVNYKVWYDGNGNTGENYTNNSDCNSSNVCGINRYASGSRINGSVFESGRIWEYDKEQNLIANKFIRTGYKFDGWSKVKGASKDYNDKQTVSKLTSVDGNTITLYAVWKGNNYSVSFNPNGGTGTMGNLACTYGSICTLPSNKFTNSGYTFGGWATSPNGDKEYDDNEEVENLTPTDNGSVPLYAVWVKNSYKITLKRNGAESISGSSVTCVPGKSCKLPTIRRTGGTVYGFGTTADCRSNQSCFVGNSYTQSGSNDVTLYAITSIDYRVIFDSNGSGLRLTNNSADGGSSTESVTQTCTSYNANYGCTVYTPNIEGDFYYFSLDKNDKGVYDSTKHIEENTSKKSYFDQHYYVVYDKLSATFVPTNGSQIEGSSSSNVKSCIVLPSNKKCNITSPTFSRNGYTVVGYNTANNATSSSWNAGTSKQITSNVTYYTITKKDLSIDFTGHDGLLFRGSNANSTLTCSSGNSCIARCSIYNDMTKCENIVTPDVTSSKYVSNPKFWANNGQSGTPLSKNSSYFISNDNNGYTYYLIGDNNYACLNSDSVYNSHIYKFNYCTGTACNVYSNFNMTSIDGGIDKTYVGHINNPTSCLATYNVNAKDGLNCRSIPSSNGSIVKTYSCGASLSNIVRTFMSSSGGWWYYNVDNNCYIDGTYLQSGTPNCSTYNPSNPNPGSGGSSGVSYKCDKCIKASNCGHGNLPSGWTAKCENQRCVYYNGSGGVAHMCQ